MSTPLHWACISHSHNAVRYLLAWGASVNATDLAGYMPLHLALRDLEYDHNRSLMTIRRLVRSGARLDHQDQTDRLPQDYILLYRNNFVKAQVAEILSYSTSPLQNMIDLQNRNSIPPSAFTSRLVSYTFYFVISLLLLLMVYFVFPHIG